MAKPVALPRWATDLSNNTEPSAGQKDTGWTPNQVAVSDYFNWLGELVYRWFDYQANFERTITYVPYVVGVSTTWTVALPTTSANGSITLSIPIEAGWTVTGIRLNLEGDNVADITSILVQRIGRMAGGAATNMNPSPSSLTNVSNTSTNYTIAVDDLLFAAGDVLVVGLTANATGIEFDGIEVAYKLAVT